MARKKKVENDEISENSENNVVNKKTIKKFLKSNYPEAMSTEIISEVKYLDTGIPTINYVLSGRPITGGIPLTGKITLMYGPEGCLDGDTFIQYSLMDKKTGKIFNHKGGNISHLYERFHNICEDGRCNKIDRENTVFYINSIDEKTNRIIRQPIADVVKTGFKECFELMTSSGKRIIITKDHNFYIGNGKYSKLEDLKIGSSTIYVHDNITNEKYNKIKNNISNRRNTIAVKYHPSENIKIVDGKYSYCRVLYSHIVYEANVNKMSINEYISMLNNNSQEFIRNLYTIPNNFDIHHIDENPYNNNIENLKLLDSKEHNRMHALNNIENLSYVAVEDKIISIMSVGNRETYDIKCFYPYNNYIANNIVVHNSGKTSFVAHIIASALKHNIIVIFMDSERSMTIPRLHQFGVNEKDDNFVYITPETMEECFDIIETVYNELITGPEINPILIIWDSIAMTPTKAEITRTSEEKEIASQAGVLTRNLRRIRGKVKRIEAGLLLINQARANQSKYGDIFDQPGGYALKHSADIILRINRLKPDESGQTVKISTPTKNKLFRPFQQTELRFEYAEGFTKENILDSFCEFLKNINFLYTAGPYCYLESDVIKIMEEKKITRKEAVAETKKFFKKVFVQRLLEEPDYYEELLKMSEEYINTNLVKVTKLMLDPEREEDLSEKVENNKSNIIFNREE